MPLSTGVIYYLRRKDNNNNDDDANQINWLIVEDDKETNRFRCKLGRVILAIAVWPDG